MEKFTHIPWKKLNNKQKQAIKTQGIVCVNADNGTGKTTTLVNKFLFLLKNEIPCGGILALVRNNSLVKTIREATNLEDVYTIQSFCLKVIQESYYALGLKKNFTVYTENKELLLEAIRQLRLSISPKEFARIRKYITKCQKSSLQPEKYIDIFNKYQELLAINHAIDNDSIIARTVNLFETNENVLTYYQYRYSYVLVDDYEEYDLLQNRLLKLLKTKNIFLTRDTNNIFHNDYLSFLSGKTPVIQISFDKKYYKKIKPKNNFNVFVNQKRNKNINKILATIRFIWNPYDIQSFCSLLKLDNQKLAKLKTFFYRTKCDVLTGLKTAINIRIINDIDYLTKIFNKLCIMRKQSLLKNIQLLTTNKTFLDFMIPIAQSAKNYKDFLNFFVVNYPT